MTRTPDGAFAFRRLESYYRREHFEFFKALRYPFYCLTTRVEVTRLHEYCRERNHRFYAALCGGALLALNQIPDFRYRVRDADPPGEPTFLEYDRLHARMIVPLRRDARLWSIARVILDKNPDLDTFCRTADSAMDAAAETLNLREESEHDNFVYFSAGPGLDFSGLTHVPSENAADVVPRLSFGRAVQEGTRRFVSVGMMVNHRLVDGAHLSEFFERLRTFYDAPDSNSSQKHF